MINEPSLVYRGPAKVRVLAPGITGTDLMTDKDRERIRATQDRLNKGLRLKALQARMQPKAKGMTTRKSRPKTWRSDPTDYRRPRRSAPKMTRPR